MADISVQSQHEPMFCAAQKKWACSSSAGSLAWHKDSGQPTTLSRDFTWILNWILSFSNGSWYFKHAVSIANEYGDYGHLRTMADPLANDLFPKSMCPLWVLQDPACKVWIMQSEKMYWMFSGGWSILLGPLHCFDTFFCVVQMSPERVLNPFLEESSLI